MFCYVRFISGKNKDAEIAEKTLCMLFFVCNIRATGVYTQYIWVHGYAIAVFYIYFVLFHSLCESQEKLNTFLLHPPVRLLLRFIFIFNFITFRREERNIVSQIDKNISFHLVVRHCCCSLARSLNELVANITKSIWMGWKLTRAKKRYKTLCWKWQTLSILYKFLFLLFQCKFSYRNRCICVCIARRVIENGKIFHVTAYRNKNDLKFFPVLLRIFSM